MSAPSSAAINGIIANFEQEVLAGYKRCGINPGSTLAVALSGGADSVALLVASQRLSFDVKALHCNFHLRGEESNRDTYFVSALCSQLNIECHIAHFNVAERMAVTGESVEMACRELRYEWFFRQLHGVGAKVVAVAHHRGDDVETMLLNLARGTGLRGLTGIPAAREGVVRPMLELTREQILSYLDALGIRFVTDSTNLENEYRRNKIRNLLLPALEEWIPGARKGMELTMRNLRSDLDLLDALIEEKIAESTTTNGAVNLQEISKSPSTAATLLYHILQKIIPEAARRPTLLLARQILEASSRSGAIFPIGKGYNFHIHRGMLYLQKENNPLHGKCLEIKRLPIEEFIPDPSADALCVSQALDETTLKLRGAKEGDRMIPFGMKGSKLVFDILAEHDVPASQRRGWPVVTCGETILWVVGIRCSANFAIQKNDNAFIKCTFEDA